MTIDTKRLRQLAEAATCGPWFYDESGLRIMPAEITDQHVAANASGSLGANIRFIAAANPQTVLALLDRIAAMTAARDEACAIAERRLECNYGHLAHRSREVGERIAKLRKVGAP